MNTMKRKQWMKKLSVAATAAVATAVSLLAAGCAGFAPASIAPTPVAGPALNGTVMGGRQPISGASIYMYAAGTTGYASPATNVLTSPVTTTPVGTFLITGYSCTPGQQLYLVSVGGDPGDGTNANATLLEALGDCANLSSIHGLNINEVTTVATAFALAQFASGYANVGTSATNTAGLARAFASVNKLANIANGEPAGPALAAGATEPTNEINTLADVIAGCVNSTGSSSPSCSALFTDATPPGGTAPNDTAAAAIDIAQNPANNATAIYNLAPSTGAPYSPQLTAAPADWTMSISYTGFNAPKSTSIDASGNVWVANSGNNTLTVLAQTGKPITGSPFSSNGLNAPAAVAIDASGNGWVANKGGSTVSAFTGAGGLFGSSPFTVGSAPVALAFDAPGNLWVANSSSSNVTELSSSGVTKQTVTTGVSTPTAIAIDPQ